jgi:hypothetical protein
MLVVDPWHWLHPDGSFPVENPHLYRRVLRIAQIIEYGGPLPKKHVRETLLPCSKRPKGKACPGLLWVAKTTDDAIHAYCIVCGTDEAIVHNWQETEWADGPMEGVNMDAVVATNLH